MKDQIRPIFTELKGYLAQAPENKSSFTDDESLWTSLNSAIGSLNELTNEGKYDRFRIEPTHHQGGNGFAPYTDIRVQSYRTKLSGLISSLHGEYFKDEQEPFSGTPNTLVTQTQVQSQQQSIQLVVLQLQEKIIENLSNPDLKENEKNFLSKLKEALSTANSFAGLLATLLQLASKYNIKIEDLTRFFT